MSRRRLPTIVILTLLISLFGISTRARGEDGVSIPELRKKLMFAQGDARLRSALEDLAARIGKEPGFKDAGAFGDWLKALPSGRSQRGPVLQYIGWAYVTVKRGKEAIAPLEAAMKDDPGSGFTRASLGEALRQDGRELEALEILATALAARYDKPHLHGSVMEAARGLRRSGQAKTGTGLPHYAVGLRKVLAVRADAETHATLARWLLWDLRAYDKPDSERGKLWARTAASHALSAVEQASEHLAGSQQLTYEAAVALEAQDQDLQGDSERFDLLVHAAYLGEVLANGGTHLVPQAFTLLAEAAAAEGRYQLAWRMAQKRLGISFSPRAARLVRTLPPDVGEAE